MTIEKWKKFCVGKYVMNIGVGITSVRIAVGGHRYTRRDITIYIGPFWISAYVIPTESREDAKYVCDLKN